MNSVTSRPSTVSVRSAGTISRTWSTRSSCGWGCSSTEHAIRDVGGEGRLEQADVLQGQNLIEPLEEPLPPAEHDRGDRDRELLHVSRPQSLTDEVRAAHEEHVLVARGLPGLDDGLVQAVDEGEPGIRRLVLGTMR